MNNLVGDVKANPRDFYRYINSQKKDTQGIPPLKKRQGSGLAQSDFEKASEFNGQFTDVFTKSGAEGLLERPENTFPPENAGKRRKTPKKMQDNS